MIDIVNLTYTYPGQSRPALSQVSLGADAGEFILLAGESGSGKTTLLRSLNGLIPHLSGGVIQGQVRVNGLEPVAVGPQQMSHHVGFVFQNPETQAVLDHVEPEIAFGLENSPEFHQQGKRESKAEKARIRQEMQARVAEVMALLDLTHLRKRPIRTLSGGERQKVALASALVLRPSLLVLDEPTSQLDPQAAADLLDTLVRLNRQHGYTIVLAEHRLERVLSFVSRVVYLENGRISLDAPPHEAAAHLPHVPPVVALGRQLGWEPLPLTVAEARAFVGETEIEVKTDREPETDIEDVMLAVEGTTFAYDDGLVLQDVSLTVGAGELVALMGHNGAGKSTLLQCVVGLLAAKEGRVRVNGRSHQDRSVADICREVAYLPQNPDDLLFSDSVAEELIVTLRNHGVETNEQSVDKLLAQLGLAEVQEAYPRDLSVGQRQRVALGAVTVTEPKLILLDEPTRGLDYAAKAALVAIWRQWLAQGKGILLVTHDVELVAQAAQRVVILEEGRVAATGQTAEVLPQYPTFAPQISRLFPHKHWLTIKDLDSFWLINVPEST
ncbi:MAG: ATP-binding cassette domain-containing protein [Chloroflexota bacterium]